MFVNTDERFGDPEVVTVETYQDMSEEFDYVIRTFKEKGDTIVERIFLSFAIDDEDWDDAMSEWEDLTRHTSYDLWDDMNGLNGERVVAELQETE